MNGFAADADPDDDHPPRLLVTFRVGAVRFGVAAEVVEEVIRVPVVTNVFGSDPTVLGVMNLRGRIVTVFDLATLLGMGEALVTAESRAIVVRSLVGEPLAIVVDEVHEVIDRETGTWLTSAPPSGDSYPEDWVEGILAIADELTTVLRLECVLRPPSPGTTGGHH